ncbi:hypothetical protein GCM10023215_31210 [Pseudonocardia yuanmonensis]|uniref:Hcy-binding domain-containing protein n=1 Tax=Pseudonocardia yuanmonensis TaxID=1095914 RepID=A0ABP8WLP8_9PSEU
MDGVPGSDGVLVADGGLATALEARGHDLADPLWSARLLLEAPGEILAVHHAFFRAGADLATTATDDRDLSGLLRGVRRPRAGPFRGRPAAAARGAPGPASG